MFDAIVIGSGMSGGWVAKELTEKGLKTLVIERGRHIEHGVDYTDSVLPWDLSNANRVPEEETSRDYPIQSTVYAFNAATKHYWVKDSEHPYSTPDDKPYRWIRGYHLGGRSLMWGRQSYRWNELDFAANKLDGHGSDWPIRYADVAPWYDRVEEFAGISGTYEGMPQLPDGKFLPAMALNACEADFKAKVAAAFPERRVIPSRTANLTEAKPQHEALGRSPCQYRWFCDRGCSYGAYFSSLSATLPAARNTGNLTIVTDAIAHSLVYDPGTKRVTGVKVIDANARAGRTYEAKIVILCASAIPTAMILLNSRSEAFPNGLANSSDMVGRNLMDHVNGGASALVTYPGLEDQYYHGRRPTGFVIPRYRNLKQEEDYLRGYTVGGYAWRANWAGVPGVPSGVGAQAKARVRKPGPWMLVVGAAVEMLPDPANRVTLHPSRTDKWAMPIAHIEWAPGPNERKLLAAARADIKAMVDAAGARIVYLGGESEPPAGSIHEMGTAHMGLDPKTSVLNKYNQAHDIPNLFVADGSAMASNGTFNPSLTYMALAARSAHYAAAFLREGRV